jgi:hypothetical protein
MSAATASVRGGRRRIGPELQSLTKHKIDAAVAGQQDDRRPLAYRHLDMKVGPGADDHTAVIEILVLMKSHPRARSITIYQAAAIVQWRCRSQCLAVATQANCEPNGFPEKSATRSSRTSRGPVKLTPHAGLQFST